MMLFVAYLCNQIADIKAHFVSHDAECCDCPVWWDVLYAVEFVEYLTSPGAEAAGLGVRMVAAMRATAGEDMVRLWMMPLTL